MSEAAPIHNKMKSWLGFSGSRLVTERRGRWLYRDCGIRHAIAKLLSHRW